MSGVLSSGLRPWLVAALLAVFMAINFADKIVLGLSAGPIMRDLHLNHVQFGLIGTSFFAFFSLSAIALGIAANRVSARRMLAGMMLVWSFAQSVPALFGSWSALIASRVVLGFGEGAAYPVALHSVYKWFPNDRRAVPTSVVAMGGTAGVGVAAPALSYVIAGWSWHAAFAVLSLTGLVWCSLWLAVGREGPLDQAPNSLQGRKALPYRRLLRCRTVVGVLIVGFCAYWLVTVAVVWLPAFIGARFGYGQVAIGWTMMLPILCELACVPAICAISQRLVRQGVSSRTARAQVAALCVALAGVLAALFAVLPGTTLPLICMALAFSLGDVIFVLGHVMVAEVVPARQRAAMLGVTNGVITLAGPLAPLVMGALADAGASPVDGFRHGFVAAGCFVVAGSLVGLMLMNPEADRRALAEEHTAEVAISG